MPSDTEQEREVQFLATAIDPLAQQILDAVDPWDAYRAALRIPPPLADAFEWLPHGGELIAIWSELADLYELGKTPIPDAHAALRDAAAGWLARSSDPGGRPLDVWLEHTRATVDRLFERDGAFWSPQT